MDIIQAIQSDKVFGPSFKCLKTWGNWFVFLKALFALPIKDRKERELFKECTGLERFAQPDKAARECYVICGRRGGKSFISSIIAVFLAVFKDWSPYLSFGEKGYVFIIACDKFQARIIKNYISGILNSQSIFKNIIEKDLSWEIHLKSQIVISVKTASYRTIRGYSVVCAILEEVAFWRSEEYANPAKEIITALRPALATIPESLLIGISTPYNRFGALYDAYKKHWGKADGPLIWKAKTQIMNPTINEELIKKDFEADPIRATAEWGAEFRSDVEAFLPLEVVEAAVIPGRFELPKIGDVRYKAFLDPSGGRQDSMCLAISHKEKSGKIILDVLRERRPPFKPSDVVEEFSKIIKAYDVHTIESDRYAGEWVNDSFGSWGITVKNSEITKSEIYLEFLPILQNGSVELLDNKRLVSQLSNLERKTRSGGKDLVDHPFGYHDDVANTVAGACVMSGRKDNKAVFMWTKYPMY